MLTNYLKLTWRNVARNSTYSTIIVTGLVLAYSACLTIFLFVKSEIGYDHQSPDADRMYRVIHDAIDDKGTVVSDATTSAALAPVLVDNIQQIESYVRITPMWGIKALVRNGSNAFYEQRLFGADSNMISFFGLKVLRGEPILRDKKTVAISESIAKKYFGDEDPIDKMLEIQEGQLYRVGAVFEDAPFNMHFHCDIISWIWTETDPEDLWDTYNFFTYIKLREGANIADVQQQIQRLYEKYRPNRLDQFYTQPLTDIHLRSKTKWEIETNGDEAFVTIFITIGAFIFLIASVNYINLSIVQALNRSKEVGVRKVSGAQTRELVDQFLLESILISIVSLILAVAIVQGLRPLINAVFDQHLPSLFSLPYYYVSIIFVCSVIAGLLSGLYSALYLSAFQPAVVLKGMFHPASGNVWLRKALVVLQFAISIALIAGAVLVFMQVNYLRSKNLGFNKDQVIIVQNIYDFKEKNKLKEAFKNVNGVEYVGGSNGILGVGMNSTTSLAEKSLGIRSKVDFSWVDEDYLNAVGVEVVQGRLFTKADINDGMRRVVLNQKAVMDLGLTDEEAVGALVTLNPYADSVVYHEVIGVVKDFHFTSLRTQIMPYAFFLFGFQYQNNFAIKVSTADYQTLLDNLGKAWISAGPPGPFEYFFMDEGFDKLYRTEENFKLIFAILTAISIYIACSGLFAVASYFIKRRTREIGIHKALGASVTQVTWLVSSGFIRMVIIANLVAWPVTYMFMNRWLSGFAYRIDINWMVFLISAVLALVIAVVTIGGQSVRAAQANPIQSLRNE